MTEKKQAIIKAITTGDLETLQQITKGQVSVKNILLSFYYLLHKGRPGGYSTPLSYTACYVTSISQVQQIKEACNNLSIGEDYTLLSDDQLNLLLECMECYRVLKEQRLLY